MNMLKIFIALQKNIHIYTYISNFYLFKIFLDPIFALKFNKFLQLLLLDVFCLIKYFPN